MRQTEEIVSLTKALDLWYTIEDHLKRAEVKKEDVDGFPAVLEKFELNINDFYECDTDTFLSGSGNNVGDDETYYLHALKYYIPVHAKKRGRITNVESMCSRCKDSSVETKNQKIY